MIERYDNYGIGFSGDTAVVSFEILKRADSDTIEQEKATMNRPLAYSQVMKLKGYTVATYGEYNNVPGKLRDLIKNNHLLPELLSKQVRYMYGKGPVLYREELKDDKIERIPLKRSQYAAVWQWLNSWKASGMADDVKTYLKRAIREYYYTEGIFTKWAFNKSRRVNGRLPVRGLEYVPSTRARLATLQTVNINDPIEDEAFDLVLYGGWDKNHIANVIEYPRFDETKPLANPVAVNYTRDFGYGEEIYSFPAFYYGLKEWIQGSNINPKYINSYLKNSLSAKLHVLIPDQWIISKADTLREICDRNRELDEAGKEMITEYEGLTGIGKEFSYGMVNKLIDLKIESLTKVLSGAGENQGKTFVTRKFKTEYGIEEWEFKEIPMKYKEFVTSILDYDKRAVEVILAGKGIDPSISNVSKDGIFQSSGSGAYYNYLIYLNSLYYAEEYITYDINAALHLNFPELKQNNIVLGFMRNIPQRQEELKPDQRLDKITKN